jgi:predicted Zn finger-like uncharacterized protein
MIFDCPRCEAENAIPVADIPPDGKVAVCGACKQPFRVLPPDPDDLDDDTGNFETNAENTTVGAPMPFDDVSHDDPTGGYFVPPTPPAAAPSAAAAPPARPVEVEPPLIARDTSDLPPEILGGGLNTQDGGLDDTILPGADGRTLGRRPRSRPVDRPTDDRTPPSGVPALATVPLAPRPVPPVVVVPPAPGRVPAAGLAWHARIPLAAKVGLAVFPVALAAAVLARPSTGTDHAPIAVAPLTTRTATAPPAPPRPPSWPAHSPLAHDRPASDGRAYVVAAGAALASRVGSASVDTLPGGQAVRVVERNIEGHVLVWVEPKGPAGFLRASEVDVRMPVGALADAIVFQRCTDKAACATELEPQSERCHASCELSDDETLRARCIEACAIARERCELGCAGKGAPRRR